MKKSILPILAFALVLTACNSNLTSSSSSASSTPVSTASSTSSSSTTSGSSSSSSSSSTTPIPVTESALDLFKTAAEVNEKSALLRAGRTRQGRIANNSFWKMLSIINLSVI